MPIFSGSRFESLSFTPLTDDEGVTRRFIHLRVPPAYISEIQHEVLPTEELDYLAFQYRGQARRWWEIAEANDMFWPLDVPQGTRLDMPT
jgi:hypothetical protein